ncbi:MAG TPA: hypothetical protein VGF97_07385 [Rhizomicrobium sp.]|jgi:hypothetical protein
MRAGDFCFLAAELVDEHGAAALGIAQRATAEFVSEGMLERARFWYALSLFMDDIVCSRIDPERPIVLH